MHAVGLLAGPAIPPDLATYRSLVAPDDLERLANAIVHAVQALPAK